MSRAEGLRPFFSYFGGKWRDAVRNYPAPKHDVIVEPFAGGAGYATRYFDRKVRLYDLNETIVGVWRYLIRASPSEIRALPLLRAGESLKDLPRLCPEARALVGFNLGVADVAPRKRASPWSLWGRLTRERLARQVVHIRHWTVEQRSYADIPENPRATWFVDPPYQGAGTKYTCSAKALDFEHLGAWCRARSGQTIVCENDGAMWLPFWTLGVTANANRGKQSGGLNHEVVWIGEDGRTAG